MTTTETLEQIAADIDRLGLSEQLWLIERLAHRIRSRSLPIPTVDSQALADMANDPAIQRELQAIETEFAGTEPGGLRW